MPSKVVGGRFNKEGNLHTRYVFSSRKTSRWLHLATRIFRVYIEAFPGLRHMPPQDGLSHTLLSQGRTLEMALAVGIVGKVYLPRTEEGARSL